MIPPAPQALLHKLHAAERQQLFSPDSKVPVTSPCISVCRMDEARQYCVGCLRTLDELRAWGNSDDPSKRKIWLRIRQRAASTTVV